MAFIADVFNVVLLDKVSGDAIATTTLQSGDIDVSVQENEIRAGQGAQLLGVLHAQRDININLTDAEFKYEWLAKQLGQDIATGAGVAYAMPKWYTVVDNASSMEITLDQTPTATNNGLKIFKADGTAIANPTVADAVVTLTGVTAGDKVEVRTYKYDTDATTETINIDGSVFAKGVVAILETIEIDGNEIATHRIQYQFDNTVPTGNFTISTASERQASTQQFNLRVLKPSDSTVVGRVLRMPV